MTNVTIGDVTNSTVVVGNDNFVVKVDSIGAGATVNIVKPEERPNYSARPAPVVKLPKPPQELLGRQKELSVLLKDAQASSTVSLWARKGMGKTTLARYLTNALNQQDASQSVVYLDALGLGREDLLQALFDLFFDSLPSYKPSPATIPNSLQKVKSLVFIDNLTLSGEAAITSDDVESLINAAPNCAFVLISTQRALSGEGDALALPGLPEADAIALFVHNFGRALDDAEKVTCGKICALLKGCPDEIIRLAIRGHDAENTPAELLAELGGSSDDKSLATLATAKLNDADRKVLAYLAAAGENAVPLEVLQNAFQGMDISAELEHLKALDLVQSHSPRYSLCGTLTTGLAEIWDLDPARDALLNTSISWLSQQQPSETVEQSLGMLLHTLADAARRKKWLDVIRLGRLMEGFVVTAKRWQAWADLLNLIVGAAQGSGDHLTEGWALHELGSRALAQGAFEPARTYLNQSLKIREYIHDRAGTDVTRHNLEVLKGVTAPQRGNGNGRGSSGGGGHPLTYGFFGFAGLVLVAAAAYLVMHRTPSATPTTPPIISTTPVVITPSWTPSPTLTPTLTSTPTETATWTPTWTPSPTGTPATSTPFTATVTVDNLSCRYGPGAPYLYYFTLSKGNVVEVLGRADTAFGPWLYVKFMPTYTLARGFVLRPCWVNPKELALNGDIATLAQYYPERAPLILFDTSPYPPDRFPPPSDVAASRDGNQVYISWTGIVLAKGDAPDGPRFLVETWSCIAGQMVFTPMGAGADVQANPGTLVQLSVSVQDDSGCSEASHANVYLSHVDGYVGPVFIGAGGNVGWP